jgi:hypothetical protein
MWFAIPYWSIVGLHVKDEHQANMFWFYSVVVFTSVHNGVITQICKKTITFMFIVH